MEKKLNFLSLTYSITPSLAALQLVTACIYRWNEIHEKPSKEKHKIPLSELEQIITRVAPIYVQLVGVLTWSETFFWGLDFLCDSRQDSVSRRAVHCDFS